MFLNLYTIISYYNTSMLILNIPYIRKYHYLEDNCLFLIFLKKSFFAISPKITTFEETAFFLNCFEKMFLPICPKISTFRAKLRYFFRPENINISRKRTFFKITLKKSFFAHIPEISRFDCFYQHL